MPMLSSSCVVSCYGKSADALQTSVNHCYWSPAWIISRYSIAPSSTSSHALTHMLSPVVAVYFTPGMTAIQVKLAASDA